MSERERGEQRRMNISIPNRKSFGATTNATLIFNGTTDSELQVMTTSASTVQGVTLPALSQTHKIEEIPYDEGMALYYQIKQRHSDLFRELADL